MSKHIGVLSLLAVTAVLSSPAWASPPKFEGSDIGGYMKALQQSNDPEAKTTQKQIEDGPADLKRERLLTQQAGIPLVAPTPKVPADQNATTLYTRWTSLRRERNFGLPNYAAPMGYRYTYTPEQVTRVQKILDNNHDIFDLLHQATERPLMELTAGDLSMFGPLREASREINTESYLLATQGRYADAIANESRGFRIARQVTDQRTYIAYLVAVAIRNITLSGMRDILYVAGPNEDVDNRVATAIQTAEPISLTDALAGEVALGIKTTDQMRDAVTHGFSVFDEGDADTASEPAKKQSLTPEQTAFMLNTLDASEARYLAGIRAIVGSADLPTAERRKRFAQLTAAHPSEDNDSQANPVKSMEGLLMSVFTTSDKVDDTLSAREAVTITAAMVLATKARTGEFPSTLPDGLIDPFTGKSLSYRKEGPNGFVVYSVGADGKFDGGKPGGKAKPDQVLFRYPAPAQIPVPKSQL